MPDTTDASLPLSPTLAQLVPADLSTIPIEDIHRELTRRYNSAVLGTATIGVDRTGAFGINPSFWYSFRGVPYAMVAGQLRDAANEFDRLAAEERARRLVTATQQVKVEHPPIAIDVPIANVTPPAALAADAPPATETAAAEASAAP